MERPFFPLIPGLIPGFCNLSRSTGATCLRHLYWKLSTAGCRQRDGSFTFPGRPLSKQASLPRTRSVPNSVIIPCIITQHGLFLHAHGNVMAFRTHRKNKDKCLGLICFRKRGGVSEEGKHLLQLCFVCFVCFVCTPRNYFIFCDGLWTPGDPFSLCAKES